MASLKQAIDEPRIQELTALYAPLHEAFSEKYIRTSKEKDKLRAKTLEVKRKEEALRQVIGKWDLRLQMVFYEDTAEYTTLLPNKRNPFQVGAREQRLMALSTFKGALTKYPELSALQKEVAAFHKEFNQLRSEQQEQATTVSRMIEQLKEVHAAATMQMYKNLGMLMFIFGNTYELTAFFKLSVIRRGVRT